MKNIMVTGNLGYIGNVLVPDLINRGYCVTGVDAGYYADCCLTDTVQVLDKQLMKDIRDLEVKDFEGIDAVIHLAALSNDPLGEFQPSITEDINYLGTLHVAECAKKAKVKRFIFASSQSIYGVSEIDAELDEDLSIKNPVTAYAKTKWQSECDLLRMNDSEFSTVFFRPSTVFGVSPNLRCDIVFNNFVAGAYTSGKIEIKSDGTPWRPIVHIKDVANAFIAGVEAPLEIVKGRVFNVGIENGNYSVRELAVAAQEIVSNTELIFTGEHVDSRTYKVSFERILKDLKGYYTPKETLKSGGESLVKFFDEVKFTQKEFSGDKCNRLLKLKQLLSSGKIDSDFRVTDKI